MQLGYQFSKSRTWAVLGKPYTSHAVNSSRLALCLLISLTVLVVLGFTWLDWTLLGYAGLSMPGQVRLGYSCLILPGWAGTDGAELNLLGFTLLSCYLTTLRPWDFLALRHCNLYYLYYLAQDVITEDKVTLSGLGLPWGKQPSWSRALGAGADTLLA